MKTLIASASLLWVALVTELAWPTMIPRGALLLPIVCGAMYWIRSSAGLAVTGLLLLLDWIARPTVLPLCPMLLPFAAVLCVAPSRLHNEYRSRSLALRIPQPLQLPSLTLMALLLQVISEFSLSQWANPDELLPLLADRSRLALMVAIPLSAVLSLLVRAGDELGLRRAFTV
jgi:hypothetical protein